MVPIKNVGNLASELLQTKPSDKQVKSSANANTQDLSQTSETQKSALDRVKVSDSARTMLQRDAEVQHLSEQMESVETLSPQDRLEIESKIESGFYSSPDVISAVAGRIAEEAGENDKDSSKEELTAERLQEVIENIRSNKYDSNEILEDVAEKILKDL